VHVEDRRVACCYICGQEESRRIVTERLMLPVCRSRECSQVAAALPESHCSARLPGGHLCGTATSAQLHVDGARLCLAHFRAYLAASER
jgi:hypothetical protein